ncbi:MAG: TIGR01459 family HAD-type hydrolase [Rhizobiales bacterium]|nr:TIGR01459 family HAD-type hydrolase [Hyphomicrobiales bacterium]
MANISEPQPIPGLSALAGEYRALLCDVWGVVHNGVAAFPEAAAALGKYRAGGGKVVMLTNAPRVRQNVVDMLDSLGFPRDAYDDVVTSGETGRELLRGRPGVRVLHVGPGRGLTLFDDLDLHLVPHASDAELIVCTGLFDDETEVPEDYDGQIAEWKSRKLPMLCVNPDVVVDRGNTLIWCAGAIANRYRDAGGETTMVGKPYPAIYATAMKRLGELAGGAIGKERVLAIGDGAQTDVRGAVNENLDVLFIAGGIHAGQFGDRDRPDAGEVAAFLGEHALAARAFAPKLTW